MAHTRYGLPWEQDDRDGRRLRIISWVLAPAFLVAMTVLQFIPVPEKPPEAPPRMAQLLLEPEPEQEPEPVPEPIPEPVVPSEPEPGPEPELEPAPEPQPAPAEQTAAAPEPEPPGPEPQEVEQARETARNTGIMAMTSELSLLRNRSGNTSLQGPRERNEQPAAAESDRLADRAAADRSRGVDDQHPREKTRQVAMQQREQTRVEAPRETASAPRTQQSQPAQARNREVSRSREELRRTMDANKAAVFSIYNRELRRKPSLRGTVTPELVIEESGAVSSCSVVESTLDEPTLEAKICARLQLVNFGEKQGAERTTIRYPIELLPG